MHWSQQNVFSGTNLEDNLPLNTSFFNKIDTAVRLGLLDEGLVREMAKPLFLTRMRCAASLFTFGKRWGIFLEQSSPCFLCPWFALTHSFLLNVST